MTQSREERRADKRIAMMARIEDAVKGKILEHLYEETRPRDEAYRCRAGFIDDENVYLELITPLRVAGFQELCAFMDAYGVVNVRRVRAEADRQRVIDGAIRQLIEAEQILTDLDGTKFHLSYGAYQLEACRDDGRRQERQRRYVEKCLRRQALAPMSVAS